MACATSTAESTPVKPRSTKKLNTFLTLSTASDLPSNPIPPAPSPSPRGGMVRGAMGQDGGMSVRASRRFIPEGGWVYFFFFVSIALGTVSSPALLLLPGRGEAGRKLMLLLLLLLVLLLLLIASADLFVVLRARLREEEEAWMAA